MTAIGQSGSSTMRVCICGRGVVGSRYAGDHCPGPVGGRGRVLCRLSGWRVSRPLARVALGCRPGDPAAMMTICPGWPATDSVPVHVVPIVLADDGVADGRVSH